MEKEKETKKDKYCSMVLEDLQNKIYRNLLKNQHIDPPATSEQSGIKSTELPTDPGVLKNLCEELLREIGSKETITAQT